MPVNRDISEEILEYLSKHPDATDTLEGITEWWLMSQKISYEMERVKLSIQKLVKEGWVIEVKVKDTAARYRFNAIRLNDLRSLPSTKREE
jgi:hypothetical protein